MEAGVGVGTDWERNRQSDVSGSEWTASGGRVNGERRVSDEHVNQERTALDGHVRQK